MITFGFFDSVDGDRKYSADDISNFFETLIPDGVMAEPENTLQVCESSGLTIKILPGWGFIQRKWIHSDADVYLTLDQPDIILNRADRIVLRLNRTLRTMEIAIRRGTASESPVLPSLQRDDTIWEISLAYVMVWAGAESITQNDIGDERNDAAVCGRILGFGKVKEIETILNNLNDDCYHCNQINDNVALPTFIQNWYPYHRGKVLKIIGSFGVNDDYTEIDGIPYSMNCQADITIDFADCHIITAKSRPFAYFRNCTVKNLKLNYPELTTEYTAILHILEIKNAVLESCHISGSLEGSTGIICYHVHNGRLINCTADFSSDSSLWGIMASGNSFISYCTISVEVTGDNSAYGISAITSHISDSDFKSQGKNAYGGQTGGNFTGCTFTGLGNLNGYGFSVSGNLQASECSFCGYTKNTENGKGIGIAAGNYAKLHLHGISCPADAVSGYSQTGSLAVADGGQGYYDGILYTAPVLPLNDSVVSYTDFVPTSVMTQSVYDSITPRQNRNYILTED